MTLDDGEVMRRLQAGRTTRGPRRPCWRTHIPEAPWWVVQADDKKKARLNCIHHLLSQMPYEETERETINLPRRQRHEDYVRHPVPAELIVPEVY